MLAVLVDVVLASPPPENWRLSGEGPGRLDARKSPSGDGVVVEYRRSQSSGSSSGSGSGSSRWELVVEEWRSEGGKQRCTRSTRSTI